MEFIDSVSPHISYGYRNRSGFWDSLNCRFNNNLRKDRTIQQFRKSNQCGNSRAGRRPSQASPPGDRLSARAASPGTDRNHGQRTGADTGHIERDEDCALRPPTPPYLGFRIRRFLISVRRASASESRYPRLPAFGFLQIPPRGGHPCRSAICSPCRAGSGVAPSISCALPGAPRKKGRTVLRSALSHRRWIGGIFSDAVGCRPAIYPAS